MNKLIIIILLSLSLPLASQSTHDFLDTVAAKNPYIIAAYEKLAAEKALLETGLNPSDPVVSAGYFPGNNQANANKITWGISQSVDFPSSYIWRKKLSGSRSEIAELSFMLERLKILSETRQKIFELIAYREKSELIRQRVEETGQTEEAYRLMVEAGELPVTDYNRVKLRRAELISDKLELENRMATINIELDYISGGNSSLLKDAVYPPLNVPELDSILCLMTSYHPGFLLPEKKLEEASNRIKLSRAASLPSIELAYSSEIVADERFTGPSVGLSIPVWNNKGKVTSSKKQYIYLEKEAEATFINKKMKVEADYCRLLSTIENLEKVNETLVKADNRQLLKKALETGEISVSEYFIEMEAHYMLEDRAADLKREIYKLLSVIFETDFVLGI